jgi:uncharacterized protein YdeI (YjbR/CyaY-like superfamily)
MPKLSSEVDRYIEQAAPFARPILIRIRTGFHKGCPDVEETIKWGVPHFEYKGIVGNMAAFKQHVMWGFWKAKLMSDPHGILAPFGTEREMGGSRVTDVSELPSEKVFAEYVRQAAKLNEEGVKAAPRPRRAAAPVEVPADLQKALKKNGAALKQFEKFSPSQKREYCDWLIEAKQDATRRKRLETALEWIAEGKPRNWKYMK